MPKQKLTHLDDSGKARMVDVGEKAVTARRAVAEGFVLLLPGTLRAIAEERVPKGEVLGVARVAGIMAAKRTGELIPLCHPLPLESVDVDFDLPSFEPADGEERVRLRVKAAATITARARAIRSPARTRRSMAARRSSPMSRASGTSSPRPGIPTR